MATARKIDENGYITIERNPISRAGVFQYSGASIGGDADPDRIYDVYRPPEVLQEAAPTFRLNPLINDHTWIGEGGVPAEAKGVHGTIGANVEFDPTDDVLYGDLKIWSETLATLLEAGKTDLSLGYHCEYEFAPGIAPNGRPYQYIQKSMRGNHIALVDEARCAVAVLDHFVPTCDSLEVAVMAKEQAKPDKAPVKKMKANPAKSALDEALKKFGADVEQVGGQIKAVVAKDEADLTIKDLAAVLGQALPLFEKMKELAGSMSASVPAEVEDVDPATASGDVPEVVEGADKTLAAMDGKLKAQDDRLKAQSEQIEALKKGGVKTLLGEIARRDSLATRLSHHIGTFDHSEMTLGEVAKYGVTKLELKAEDGQELPMLEGFLKGAPTKTITAALDERPRSNLIENYLTPQEA